MVAAWTGYTGVIGRLWVFFAVFHSKTGPDLRRTCHGAPDQNRMPFDELPVFICPIP
jgi:hypothetical protein